MGKIELPETKSGYYEIRLESIGGLGANLCGKMLGELGLRYLGLNSVSFSSYGSEKTGTPVKGFIRYCRQDKEIRIHSPILSPDLLVFFHQALLKDEGACSGVHENTDLIVSLDGGEQVPEGESITGKIPNGIRRCYVINGQQIAIETHSRINMVMLGAIARVTGFIDLEDVNRICADTLGKKYPEALKGNLEGIRRGYEEVRLLELPEEKRRRKDEIPGEAPNRGNAQREWGYATAPIGGINPKAGSTVAADLSPSRQGYIPIFIKERCINCGFCDSTCPDMVFQFKKGIYQGKEMMVNQGLDYYHCKGCLRCVQVCPVNALVQGLEAEHPDKDYFLPNQELLRSPEGYIKSGPDGYVTSESYLTEKRMEGGEV